jgi:hypothetical protein
LQLADLTHRTLQLCIHRRRKESLVITKSLSMSYYSM